jgi:D-alanine-D-alanine ligase
MEAPLIGYQTSENHICVVFGGRSSEHEISLRSALFVLKSLPTTYRIIPTGIQRTGEIWTPEGSFLSTDFQDWTTQNLELLCKGQNPFGSARRTAVEPSVFLPFPLAVCQELPVQGIRVLNLESQTVFPVLHGPNGEDGHFQGLMELAEMALVGCDIRASVIGIDKHIAKRLAKDAGVPVNDYCVVQEEEWQESSALVLQRLEKRFGFPCFVKPNALGSAVGVGKCHTSNQLEEKITQAFQYDTCVMVEEMMHGTEVEVAFLGTPTHPSVTLAGEIAPKDFYDYDSKYINDDGAAQFIPARLGAPEMQKVREYAVTLSQAFGLRGLCRIDFWYNAATKAFVFNEINTLPGLTSISMFPKLWEQQGVLGPQWTHEVIVQAKAYRRLKSRKSFQH